MKCSIKHFFLLIKDVLRRQILFIMLLSYDRMIKLKGLDEKWNWNVILKLMSWKALFLHHFVTSLTTPDVTFKMTRTFLRLWFLSTYYQYLSVGMEIYDVMWCYYKYESDKIPASSIDPIIIFLQVQSHKTSPNSWRKHSFYKWIILSLHFAFTCSSSYSVCPLGWGLQILESIFSNPIQICWSPLLPGWWSPVVENTDGM